MSLGNSIISYYLSLQIKAYNLSRNIFQYHLFEQQIIIPNKSLKSISNNSYCKYHRQKQTQLKYQMFMRQMLKQGEMYKLDRKVPTEETYSQNQIHAESPSQMEDQQRYGVNQVRARRSQDFQMNVEEMAMKNGAAVIVCGMIMCCLMTVIGSAIFYFFIFDYVKPYIPDFAYNYVPFLTRPPQPLFLSQQNAKQYFAQKQLMAGEFHYARVPVEYWDHRIETIKSMGMNALSVYVFWNYHEVSKGVFDFETQNKNLTYFLELAKKYDMDVLLRPGPYVCAEWDFGGLPTRFLNIEGMKIRQNNPLFLAETKIYFTQLSKVIRKYIKNKENPQGPILMIQVQNEPTWYTKDKDYILALKKLLDDINLGCPLYFDDVLKGYNDNPLFWKNAILAVNSRLFNINDFERLTKQNNFVLYGEVYSGWFSSWKTMKVEAEHINLYNEHFLQQFQDMISANVSFSMYVVHGGTNFGLTAGYNFTTSYDYFSPINEQGHPTGKYHIFKSLVINYRNYIPPKAPAPIESMSTVLGQLKAIGSLFQTLPSSIAVPNQMNPLIFESNELKMYNQGMVLYETTIKGPNEYVYQILVHDIALIYLDGQYKETLVRTDKKFDLSQEQKTLKLKCQNPTCKLEILVEALGHVNFGIQQPLDHKGILKFVDKQSKPSVEATVKQWKHYPFDLVSEPKWKNAGKCDRAPCLYIVQKDLTELKDTYLNLEGLKKGYVWVNGRNLGRYWDIGPQISLYCPGVWLKEGKNRIVILDLYTTNASIILKSSNQPVYVKSP